MKKILLAISFVSFFAGYCVADKWEYYQPISVKEKGLYEIELNDDAMSKGLPSFDDFRIRDDNGEEISYFVRPYGVEKKVNFYNVFSSSESKYIIDVKLDKEYEVYAVKASFHSSPNIKSIFLKGFSSDVNWEQQVSDTWCMDEECSALHFTFLERKAKSLRIEMKSGYRVKKSISDVSVFVRSVKKDISQKEFKFTSTSTKDATNIYVDLPAKNMFVHSMFLDIADKSLKRKAEVFSVLGDSEVRIGHLTLSYPGKETDGYFLFSPHFQVEGSDRIKVKIENLGSDRVDVNKIKFGFFPVHLIAYFPKPGEYKLFFGNVFAQKPDYSQSQANYDTNEIVGILNPGKLVKNPKYSREEMLSAVSDTAGDIQVRDWKYKIPVLVSSPGISKAYINLALMNMCYQSGPDFRLAREGKQIPYAQGLSRMKSYYPKIVSTREERGTSKFKLDFKYANVPIKKIIIKTNSKTSFKRYVSVLFTNIDRKLSESGGQFVSSDNWIYDAQNPEPLTLSLSSNISSQGGNIYIHIENGDNKPIELSDVEIVYNEPSVIFKTEHTDGIYAYCGNKRASWPDYDLQSFRRNLVFADANLATFDMDVKAKQSAKVQSDIPKSAKTFLWIALVLAVGVLVFLVVKLLPSQPVKK
jgi:hypothetical protein